MQILANVDVLTAIWESNSDGHVWSIANQLDLYKFLLVLWFPIQTFENASSSMDESKKLVSYVASILVP